MAESKTQRKLTAILCADVVGYSRLMGADEEATIETLTAYRKVFLSHIESHSGRVVDAKGDAILAEFASVVDAVSGAMEIQRELAEKNTDLPDDRRMDFRIGINLGDVVVKDDVIYGDGVNIAARLEALAEPGGICISRPVYDQVESKLKLECEYLGEQQVKNIAKPVRAYAVNLGQLGGHEQGKRAEPDSVGSLVPDGISLDLPDKPSIAVLAFENMSGDPEQDYFSDGISEDIITDLSKISRLFVIARNASFTYKGRVVNPKQVGRELGVRFVLEGSVRKAGNRVRITAQLIEAETGRHLWAERYDRNLEDVFAVQDDITSEIVTALDVKLVRGEQARIWRKSLRNPQARDYYYRGLEHLDYAAAREKIDQARDSFEQVARLEPASPLGFVGLGFTHWLYAHRGWSESTERSFDLAAELAKKALGLDENYARAHSLMASVLVWKREHDQALAVARRATELESNSADVLIYYGMILFFSGEWEETTAVIKRAMRLCPICPAWYLSVLGGANLLLNNFQEAVIAAKQAIQIDPSNIMARAQLIRAYYGLGMNDEAESAARQLRKDYPGLSFAEIYGRLPFRDSSINERIVADLRKAGLPD